MRVEDGTEDVVEGRGGHAGHGGRHGGVEGAGGHHPGALHGAQLGVGLVLDPAAATGTHVGDIGAAVEDYVRKASGHRFGILEEYVGHGIGSKMHMAPDVLNFRSTDRGPRLRAGMALAIEPMLVRGGIGTRVLDDEWTVVTTDGARSSQWEHSVALHADGVWVLTAEDGGASELEPLGVRPVPIPEDLP